MWELCLFRGRPLVQLKKVANGDIWFFTARNWNQGCCHGNNIVGVILVFFVMFISCAKFEEHCSNISGAILNSVFYRFSGTTFMTSSPSFA